MLVVRIIWHQTIHRKDRLGSWMTILSYPDALEVRIYRYSVLEHLILKDFVLGQYSL